ncbi:autotransporter assembly complex protein TamA [Caenimonas sedimenti]|nr:BamA/TamA family outer membrane protein [Caenimonas sedimenti]
MKRCFVAHCAWLALAGLAPGLQAQQPTPAFELVVRAPEPLRALLERHLELRRYRQVSDLDDAEIARLLVLAEKDARELLATQGYFSPDLKISREGGDKPVIVVAVTPGEAAKVEDVRIDFEGEIAATAERDAVAQRNAIRTGWELPVGQSFTNDRWDSAKSTALKQLVARRYLAGKVNYSLADVDAATQRVRLGLRLESGPTYHLGPMKVSGMERYDPVLVPRLARLPEGMVYDQEKIVQAQLRLAGSGYFESAFILVDPEGDPAAAPVQVTVREAPLHKLVLGVGFTTDGGPRLTAEHTWNRVPGIGWRALTKLQAEKKNPFAQTEWMAIPDPDGWRWAVLARAERLDDDRIVTHGQRLRVGKLVTDDHIDRNVYVQYERATVQNPRNVVLTPLDTGAGSAVSVNYVWTGRYFDSVPYPNRGYGLGVEFGGGLTLAGDRRPFQRTQVRWMGIKPLEKGRLQLRAEAGAVFANSQARIPASQLFRTGGDTSVRGYKYLGIGVPLPDNLVGPGRLMAVGSVEWQRPLLRGGLPSDLEHTLFVDAGAVADHVRDLRPHVGVGTGIRWRSPVGPVEGSIAYGVKARKLRLHFTAGFVF